MSTGENEQALRKILDMTRLMAIVVLGLHYYYYCYGAFDKWRLVSDLADRIQDNIFHTGLFDVFHRSKLIALGLLIVSLLGAKGKKDERISYKTAAAYLICGLVIYFGSCFVLGSGMGTVQVSLVYMISCCAGFLLVLTGGTLLSRIIKRNLSGDIFNAQNETFPQEERLLTNEYSINLPAKYRLRGKVRRSWINLVAVFRACIVSGNPGAGKTAYVIRHFISQPLTRTEPFEPYTMLVYDFKFPDLSIIAYNNWLKNRNRYPKKSG